MPWDPEVYNQFKEERYAPFYDLAALVRPKPNLGVVDLGCGTGELTRTLADGLPGADVTGIDASVPMLQEAIKFAAPHIGFRRQTIEEFVNTDSRWDIIFSNAALQWVDGHDELFPAIINKINKGGQLAVQMPSNHNHPTHKLIRDIAAMETFKTALNGFNRESPVLSMEAYAQILFDSGGHNITVFEKAYPHILPDALALSRWTQGTALVPYMERLPGELKKVFLKEYEAQLAALFPGKPVFYPFKRILMHAVF